MHVYSDSMTVCALMFCKFGIHQQNCELPLPPKMHNSFLIGLYCFLAFKRKEEKLETSYLLSGQKIMPQAGVSTSTNTMYIVKALWLNGLLLFTQFLDIEKKSWHFKLLSNQSLSSMFL